MSRTRIGIDLAEIGRIRRSAEHPQFLTRVFSEEECAFLLKRKDPFPGFAANFAAKEAFAKALGTGIRGFSLNEVSVLRDERGAPYFSLSGNAQKLAEGYHLSVSLTHTDTLAQAMVLLEKEE